MNHIGSISDTLANADWDTLAHMLRTLNSGIDANNVKTKRLRTKVGIVRIILCEKMQGFNGENSIDLQWFMGTFKTLRSMEREFDANAIKKREFLIFLKLLMYKFGKQKLIVKKPRDTLAEFGRMKGVVENGNRPL